MLRDEDFVRRAIRLAMNGRGRVEPNPMVGCVIVKDGRVIGEGYHQQFGGPHAEPNALAACEAAGESPAGATAYVTLEPCCHLNKKTPPCAPRLIQEKIARVVLGCLDPNPAVNGQGVNLLRQAGIAVDGPLLEQDCNQLIAPFLLATRQQRPYVTLKWAQSANGLVAGRQGAPVHITSPAADRLVHELRARCDAIAVGTNTVLNDDPKLTVRNVPQHRPLLRVVLSNTLKIAAESQLVRSAGESPLLILCATPVLAAKAAHVAQLRSAGAEVVGLDDAETGHFSMADVFGELHGRRVTHLLVEPGPTLARSMLHRGQVDRVWVFYSPKPIAAEDGLAAAAVPGEFVQTAQMQVGGDVLREYLNPFSDGYFAPAASADAVLAME